jgi:hypothetical protein
LLLLLLFRDNGRLVNGSGDDGIDDDNDDGGVPNEGVAAICAAVGVAIAFVLDDTDEDAAVAGVAVVDDEFESTTGEVIGEDDRADAWVAKCSGGEVVRCESGGVLDAVIGTCVACATFVIGRAGVNGVKSVSSKSSLLH